MTKEQLVKALEAKLDLCSSNYPDWDGGRASGLETALELARQLLPDEPTTVPPRTWIEDYAGLLRVAVSLPNPSPQDWEAANKRLTEVTLYLRTAENRPTAHGELCPIHGDERHSDCKGCDAAVQAKYRLDALMPDAR